MASAFAFAGQGPLACSRALIVGDAYPQFIRRLRDAAGEASVGPTDDPANGIGPLIDAAALDAAREDLDAARRDGRCVVERDHASLFQQTEGCFFGPVVVADVAPNAAILRRETAAPILAVVPTPSLDAAIEIANDSPSPLAAVFFSRSPGNIEAVRGQLRVRALFINRATGRSLIDRHPVGGLGGVGAGLPPGGPDFLRRFMNAVTISENVMRHGLVGTEAAAVEDARTAFSSEQPV
ncbi:MAG: aldehyde dehydrogenase family protein, partial [Phycisphaerae bacterium]